MTENRTTSASKFVRGLVGCGALMLAFSAIALVAAIVLPSETEQDRSRRSRGENSGAIVATIQEFQTGIPLLEEAGLERQEDPGGIEYRWSSGPSWVKFYDVESDAELDRISAVLVMPQADESAQVLTFGLLLRLTQLASGEDVSVDAFNEWVASVAQGNVSEGQTRSFGRLQARLQGTITSSGAPALRLTIGDV